MRALAKAPEHRYQSAEAMAIALETIYASPTHELPARQVGNFTMPGRSNSTSEILTYPSQNPPLHAASYYGQSLTTDAIPAGQPVNPNTGIGSGRIIAPPLSKQKKKFRVSNTLYTVAIILILVVLLGRVF